MASRVIAPFDIGLSPTIERLAAARPRRPVPPITIRPIVATDQVALKGFYAGLSDESRRTRFLGPCLGIGDRQSNDFCTADHAHREGFVAVIGAGSRTARVVGHVCIEPDGPGSAEIALAVADDLQGHGVGRRLVEAAVAWARAEGLRSLTATMLANNPAIQRLLTSLGLASVARPIGAGVIEIWIDLGVIRSAARNTSDEPRPDAPDRTRRAIGPFGPP